MSIIEMRGDNSPGGIIRHWERKSKEECAREILRCWKEIERLKREVERLSQPAEQERTPDNELPGMWSNSDLSGGSTDQERTCRWSVAIRYADGAVKAYSTSCGRSPSYVRPEGYCECGGKIVEDS